MLKSPLTERPAPASQFTLARPGMARRDSYLPWGVGAQACCGDGSAQAAQDSAEPTRHPRTKLKDLKSSMHCSVIGTCLGGGDLRKLVARLQGVPTASLTELEVHHGAVEQAVAGGEGARLLNRMMDQQHEMHIQRFARMKTTAELEKAWRTSVQQADIPGPYWALMTHPAATEDLRRLMFGEVHMLSHLQGVGNRADLVRLRALELENTELRRKLDEQQERLQHQQQSHQKTVQVLEQQLAQAGPPPSDHDEPMALQLQGLRQQTERLTKERDWTQQALTLRDQQLGALQIETARLQEQTEDCLQLCRTLRSEVSALETALDAASHPAPPSPAAAWRGAKVLYVGGRPSSNSAIQRLAKEAGLALIIHDGGLEDRKGLLPALVPGCDLVLLPVDCVDHDSMNLLKRLCGRHGVHFRPLRTAGVASFLAALEAQQKPVQRNPLCIRHA